MAYEAKTGLGVSNQYGPRTSGGYKGDLPADGVTKNFVVDLNTTGPTILFPVTNGTAWVTGLDTTFITAGAVTDADIGAADIDAATDAAPVQIADGNTGVITQTGATAGKLIIKYKQLPQ